MNGSDLLVDEPALSGSAENGDFCGITAEWRQKQRFRPKFLGLGEPLWLSGEMME
jgi:hypothetical protein